MTTLERKIAEIVAGAPDIENAALGRLVGIAEETACRTKRLPHVQDAIARLRERGQLWRGRILQAGDVALETLVELAKNGKESTRLKAAQIIFEASMKSGAVSPPTVTPETEPTEMVANIRKTILGGLN